MPSYYSWLLTVLAYLWVGMTLWLAMLINSDHSISAVVWQMTPQYRVCPRGFVACWDLPGGVQLLEQIGLCSDMFFILPTLCWFQGHLGGISVPVNVRHSLWHALGYLLGATVCSCLCWSWMYMGGEKLCTKAAFHQHWAQEKASKSPSLS